jgi:folate-binding protein YgfZ
MLINLQHPLRQQLKYRHNQSAKMASRASTGFICSRCIYRSSSSSNRASFSTSSTLRQLRHELPPTPPTSGYALLSNRSLIAVTGADSTSFLQGMITQNMLMGKEPVRAPRRTASYSAFLNSQGRVLHDVFIYPISKDNIGAAGDNGSPADETAWLIEVDKSEVTNLVKHLRKHKLRAKLTIRALEDGEHSVWAAWNDQSTEPRWAAYNLESDFSSSSRFPDSLVVGCIDTRAPGFGTRYITPGSEDLHTYFPEESRIQVQGEKVDLSTYTLRRILHGVAEGQQEIIRESALPMEYNMDVGRAIDFRKGCYVGQELTIRTHHTGVVRKRILPVQLYDVDQDAATTAAVASGLPVFDPDTKFAQPLSGANISRAGGRRGRSAGKFISGIGNVGLALCRLEMMTDISLTGESSQYSHDQEFQVTWEDPESSLEQSASPSQGQNQVKVKALVPAWLREHIVSNTMRHSASSRSSEGLRARDLVERLEEEEAEEK